MLEVRGDGVTEVSEFRSVYVLNFYNKYKIGLRYFFHVLRMFVLLYKSFKIIKDIYILIYKLNKSNGHFILEF